MRIALLAGAGVALAGCLRVDAAADPPVPPVGEAAAPPAAISILPTAPRAVAAPVPAGGEGLPNAPVLLSSPAGLELAFHRELAGTPADVFVMRRGAEGWEPPVNVSRSAAPSSLPRLAAGPGGELHAVWGERTSNASRRPGGPATAVYYAVRSNGAWSAPEEVFRTPHEGMSLPESIVLDGEGTVHVAFAARELVTRRMTVYHAHRGRDGWDAPRVVAPGVDPDLVRGQDGGLYLAFLHADTTAGRTARRQVNSVFVTRSQEGTQWSAARRVDRSGPRPAHRPRLAVAGGELHLLWLQATDTADIYPDAVIHARSADGRTWTAPALVSAGIQGIPQSLEAAVDERGRLHLAFRVVAGIGQGPYRPFYTVWQAGAWSAPEHLLRVERSSQRIALATAKGGGVDIVLGAEDLGATPGLFHIHKP